MGLLGYSQTFIGVLTSLVVLCILDSGNFIHGILEKIGERIKNEIASLDQILTIDKNVHFKEQLKGEATYKLFDRFIKKPSEWEGEGKDVDALRMEALKLEMNLKATFSENKSTCSPNLIMPAHTVIEKIMQSNEKMIAPLYVLLYCLVAFLCDEIVYWNYEYADFVVTFLSLFTMLSFAFWLILWCSFLCDVKLEPELVVENENTNTRKEEAMKEWICKHAKWKISFIGIIAFFILCTLCSSLINILFLKQICVFIVGIFSVIMLIAYCRVKSHVSLGQYLYVFSLKHFSCLFFLALLMAIIIKFSVSLNQDFSQILFVYKDFMTIKMAVIAFIIINGLLFPFILPCFSFYKIQRLVSKEIDKVKKEMDEALTDAKIELKEFCKKL